MRILVTGASGFVGRRLVAALGRQRHEVLRLTRGALNSEDPRQFRWDPEKSIIDEAALQGLDAVVHLAGKGIADGRWTPGTKEKLRESRVQATRLLVDALAAQKTKPKVFLAASAVGFYGDRDSEDLYESSSAGTGFLPSLCEEWERESGRAASLGMRLVHMRLGVVLGPEGGVLKRTVLPFKLGLGGRLGSGRQYMSWIGAPDAVRAVIFLMENPDCSGVFNLTAPNPVTNAQYTQSLRRALSRPALIPVPGFVLRFLYGEMADALLLSGQKVHPQRLRDKGFTWEMPYIGETLNRMLQKK